MNERTRFSPFLYGKCYGGVGGQVVSPLASPFG